MITEKRNLPNCIRIGLGLRPMEALRYKPMAAQIPPSLLDYIKEIQ